MPVAAKLLGFAPHDYRLTIYQAYRRAHGIPLDNLRSLEEDLQVSLWMYTVLSRAEIDRLRRCE